MFSSIPGQCPLDAGSSRPAPVVTTRNISRHCRTSAEGRAPTSLSGRFPGSGHGLRDRRHGVCFSLSVHVFCLPLRVPLPSLAGHLHVGVLPAPHFQDIRTDLQLALTPAHAGFSYDLVPPCCKLCPCSRLFFGPPIPLFVTSVFHLCFPRCVIPLFFRCST